MDGVCVSLLIAIHPRQQRGLHRRLDGRGRIVECLKQLLRVLPSSRNKSSQLERYQRHGMFPELIPLFVFTDNNNLFLIVVSICKQMRSDRVIGRWTQVSHFSETFFFQIF